MKKVLKILLFVFSAIIVITWLYIVFAPKGSSTEEDFQFDSLPKDY